MRSNWKVKKNCVLLMLRTLLCNYLFIWNVQTLVTGFIQNDPCILIPASLCEFHNVSNVTKCMGKTCWHAMCRHVRFQRCHAVKPHRCVCVRLQIRLLLAIRTKRPGLCSLSPDLQKSENV